MYLASRTGSGASPGLSGLPRVKTSSADRHYGQTGKQDLCLIGSTRHRRGIDFSQLSYVLFCPLYG